MIQGSAVDLEEGNIWGGLCPLVLLQDAPGLTGSTHWSASAADDDGAALVKGVHLTAGKQDVYIV